MRASCVFTVLYEFHGAGKGWNFMDSKPSRVQIRAWHLVGSLKVLIEWKGDGTIPQPGPCLGSHWQLWPPAPSHLAGDLLIKSTHLWPMPWVGGERKEVASYKTAANWASDWTSDPRWANKFLPPRVLNWKMGKRVDERETGGRQESLRQRVRQKEKERWRENFNGLCPRY